MVCTTRWKIVHLTKTGDPGRWPDMEEEHEFFLIHVEFEVPVRHSRAEVKEQEYIWAWDAGGTPELNCKCANTHLQQRLLWIRWLRQQRIKRGLKAELSVLSAYKILGTLPWKEDLESEEGNSGSVAPQVTKGPGAGAYVPQPLLKNGKEYDKS